MKNRKNYCKKVALIHYHPMQRRINLGVHPPRQTCMIAPADRHGFTLVELLVVIANIAVLTSVGLFGYRSAMNKAKQVECMGNMRQIGIAVVSFAQDHNGSYPQASHLLDASNQGQSWIHTLAPYLSGSDDVKICPVDPKGQQRLDAGGTSYILNSFLTVEKTGPFGEPLPGSYTKMIQVPRPEKTPLAFVVNFESGVGQNVDHTHSDSWTGWGSVVKDIQVDAFLTGSANNNRTKGSSTYLFADGHVENLAAATVHGWITSGYNFADPAATR